MSLPKRRRRGIFVEPQNKTLIRPAASRTSAWHLSHPMGEGHSPVGAAYSGSIPDDVAPGRSLIYLHGWFYKYASPTDFAAFAFFARQKFKRPLPRSSIPATFPVMSRRRSFCRWVGGSTNMPALRVWKNPGSGRWAPQNMETICQYRY